MGNNERELDRLNIILTEHPKGLTIAEISKLLHLNRISTSKYLNILLGAGMAEMRIYGPSKVFYPAKRVPISSMLNFTTSLLLVLNDNLSIIDANNTLLKFFSLDKNDLLGHRIDYSPLGSFIDPDLFYYIKKGLDSKENNINVNWMIGGEERFLSIKITPTVFEDGSSGVTLIADDVTELTRYRQNLEQLVDERSKELILINEQLIKEIDGHKKARTKLKKSEHKYRELVENANSLIIQFDTLGYLNFFNEYAERFLGFSEQELMGKNIRDSFIPELDSNGKNMINLVQNLLTDPEKYVQNTCEIVKKDKSRGWVSWTNKIITDSHGTITGILAIGHDITELKRTGESLLASEQRYRTLYRDNPSMFFSLNSEGMIISVNTFGAMQLGYQVEELEGQSILKIIYKEDFQTVLEHLNICLQHPGELFHWQFRKISKQGNILWIKEDARTIMNSEGNTEIFIVCHDISDQKHIEEKLTDIINFLPDATLVIDTEGKVIAWNLAIQTLTGVKAEDIIGKGNYEYSVALYNIRDLILIDYALKPDQKIPPNYFNCKQDENGFFAETYSTYLKPEGIYLWGKASSLYDSLGNLIGAIESFRDITSMKKMEIAMKRISE